MNPTQTAQKPNVVSPENLLEKAFENDQFSRAVPAEAEDLVTHTKEHLKSIGNDWADFYRLKSEDIKEVVAESFVNRQEIRETKIEHEFSKAIENVEEVTTVGETRTSFIIEEQKGSGSLIEEAGLKLNFPALGKEIGKSIFGALSIFKEIFMDTAGLFITKKDKKAEKVDSDPAKAKAAAEKKAEKQRKSANIRAFYEGLKAAVSQVAAPEAVRIDVQEKENINKTIKLTNTSYKGIKDSFGRLTVYAASMFEKEQLDQEKQAKKQEKEQKMAAVSKGPDLNMDKVAEGGFLSSTGGQGAG